MENFSEGQKPPYKHPALEKVQAQQEREKLVAERFLEILNEKPRSDHYYGGYLNKDIQKISEDDITVYYTDSKGRLLPQFLKQTGEWRDSRGICKILESETTIEQLMVAIAERGEPTKIFYHRKDWDDSKDENNSFAGYFPYSLIADDIKNHGKVDD